MGQSYSWPKSEDNAIGHRRHCVFKMHAHWVYVATVFVAKYRRKVFDASAIDALRAIFAKGCVEVEASLIEVDGE